MLELLDGPCKGTYLVKRAPLYLRAVIDNTGKTDVLDQIEDTPRDSETLHVYKREGAPGSMHIHGTKVSGFFAMGQYRQLPEVNGATLRDNTAWQTWATNQNDKGGKAA